MFKKPFSFKGRIRRTEFGLSILISTLLWTIMAIILMKFRDPNTEELQWIDHINTLITIIATIFNLAQAVKRCHDFNESGWLSLIPIYNPFYLIFAEGTRGDNRYGSDPKQSVIKR